MRAFNHLPSQTVAGSFSAAIIITISSIITKGAGTGWTIYPPLSIKEGNKGIDLMILGLHIAGISSLIGGINYITTIKNQKIIEWNKLPLFVWTIWFTAILLIISLPFLAVAITITGVGVKIFSTN